MTINFFLIVGANGSVRAVKSYSKLGADEIVIEQKLTLPNALFRRPQLKATVTVPESAVAPQVITAETQDNIKEAIESVAGLNVRLEIVSEEEHTSG